MNRAACELVSGLPALASHIWNPFDVVTSWISSCSHQLTLVLALQLDWLPDQRLGTLRRRCPAVHAIRTPSAHAIARTSPCARPCDEREKGAGRAPKIFLFADRVISNHPRPAHDLLAYACCDWAWFALHHRACPAKSVANIYSSSSRCPPQRE